MQKDNIGLLISAFAVLITAGGFIANWLGKKLDKNTEEITNKIHIQQLKEDLQSLKRELGADLMQQDIRIDKLNEKFDNYKDNHRT